MSVTICVGIDGSEFLLVYTSTLLLDRVSQNEKRNQYSEIIILILIQSYQYAGQV
jgi:hypothetical protein